MPVPGNNLTIVTEVIAAIASSKSPTGFPVRHRPSGDPAKHQVNRFIKRQQVEQGKNSFGFIHVPGVPQNIRAFV
jgi:hypothetical protein